MQLELFPVTTQQLYKFEPCTNSWTGEPTGDTRLTVWVVVKDPCDSYTRKWIEGLYESQHLHVLEGILKDEHPTATLLKGDIFDA